MARRWQVYRGRKLLGLMNSSQIRQGLRDGVIDPFDEVCQEGSRVGRQLVECDDIFNLNEDGQEENTRSTGFAAGLEDSSLPEDRDFLTGEPSVTERTQVSYRRSRSPGRRTKESNSQSKSFFIKNRSEKVLGPLSPAEVQSLFQRGILKKSDRVQKGGSSKSVPIQQFVAVYSGAMIKAIAGERRKTTRVSTQTKGVGGASSRVLDELYKGLMTKKSVRSSLVTRKIAMILVGFLIGAGGYLTLAKLMPVEKFVTKELDRDNEAPEVLQEEAEPARPAPKVKKARQGKLVRKTIPDRPKPKIRKPPKRSQAKTRRPPRRQISKPPVRAKVAIKKPSVEPPKPARRAVRKESKFNLAALVDSNTEIGPLSYNAAALDACPIKCRLPFKHSSGVTITGVFFKAAYATAISGKSKLYVKGTLRKEGGGFVIYVQGIR